MPVLLTARNLAKSFGTRELFAGVGIAVSDGQRLALIGPNGSGKSTLLKILASAVHADAGEVQLRKGVRVAYVAQKDVFPEGSTLHGAIMDALRVSMKRGEVAHLHDEHEAELAATMVLDRVGFDHHEAAAASLSGGQRKRLALARELVKEPDVLLLDEPTNHLDLEGIQWLEGVLGAGPFASVVVTHDREFLESVATSIVELSRQYPTGTFTIDGNYSEFLRRKAEFLDGQARQEQSLANQVREDLRWLSRGAQARRTKSKSRIDASYERMDQLAELRDRNAAPKATDIDWEATGRQTQKLLVARAITKSFGGKRLFTDLDLVLSPRSVVGLLGPNGSGKSTLIKVLTGELEPDPPTPEALKAAAESRMSPGTPPPGTIRRAEKLRMVVFSQHRTEIDPGMTLSDALSPSDAVIYQGRTLHINTWARKFLFTTEQLKQPVRALSGGEQARIHIARLMLQPADVLVLDEPTNDLDIPSLEVLEESLEEFPGAVILVTHDRAMLARLSTMIVALDGKGGARHFTNLDQWEAVTTAERDAAIREERERAKKAAAPAAVAAGTPAAAAVGTSAAKPKRKLSYMEKRELEQMEATILKTEARVRELEAAMGRDDLASDHREFDRVCRELGEAQAEVTRLYDRWAELEG
jgi:ATP-binding cassette subfamily F protein uup